MHCCFKEQFSNLFCPASYISRHFQCSCLIPDELKAKMNCDALLDHNVDFFSSVLVYTLKRFWQHHYLTKKCSFCLARHTMTIHHTTFVKKHLNSCYPSGVYRINIFYKKQTKKTSDEVIYL